MTWRGFRVLLITLFLIALTCKACLVKDVPPKKKTFTQEQSQLTTIKYPSPKNVTIKGTDYLESQAPIGTFGGELVSSTIGEGPKTFNPFNCKDNISALMSGIM